jgi:hypothetical protein
MKLATAPAIHNSIQQEFAAFGQALKGPEFAAAFF